MPRRKSVPEPVPEPYQYRLDAAAVKSVTMEEYRQGTDRLLPKEEDIPFSIRNGHGLYVAMAQAMMYGEEMPDAEIIMNSGFPDCESFMTQLEVCLMAHLTNINVDHDFRLQAVAFMISKVLTLTEPT